MVRFAFALVHVLLNDCCDSPFRNPLPETLYVQKFHLSRAAATRADPAGAAAYEIVSYSGALHSFTDPGVDKHGLEGAKYNARAATRAFARCEAFLAESFAR